MSTSLYIGYAANGAQTSASTGTGQTDISNVSGVNGSISFVVSQIAGTGTGSFTWTGGGTVDSTQWSAIGVNVNAATGSSATIAWIT